MEEQQEEEKRKYFNIVLIRQEQSCTSELFKAIQDAVLLILLYKTMFVISSGFFQYICHCWIWNQFSFHHQFRIDTGRSKFEQQTDSVLSACGTHGQKQKHPDTIDLEAPRLARYMHTAWKKHQNTVYWVDIKLAMKKGLKFYQTRSNATILYNTLPAYCIPKVVRMETGEVIYEKGMCVTSSSSEDFFET